MVVKKSRRKYKVALQEAGINISASTDTTSGSYCIILSEAFSDARTFEKNEQVLIKLLKKSSFIQWTIDMSQAT